MSEPHVDDLKQALQRHYDQSEYNPSRYDEGASAVRTVADAVRDADTGHISLEELLKTAKDNFPEFDFVSWLKRWESEGVYDFSDTELD